MCSIINLHGIIKFIAGIEPEYSRMVSENANHYATEMFRNDLIHIYFQISLSLASPVAVPIRHR